MRFVAIVGLLLIGCTGGSEGSMPQDGGADGIGLSAGGTLSSTPIASVTADAVFVVNGASSSISVIDVATARVMGTIALIDASYPHHINLSPDRTKLLVAVPGMDMSMGHSGGMAGMKGAVMVLDATTGATLGARRLEAMNHNAIFSPDGGEIWTALMDSPGSVLVLDPATLETRQTIPVGDAPAEVTFSKDGKLAFVANGMSDSVAVIDPTTKKVVNTISVGKDPVGAWAGDDEVMYVTCESGKSLYAIDAKSQSVLRTYDLGFTPGMARTPPDGTSVWITDEDDGKVIVNKTTADVRLGEVATGAGAHGIAFSADGKTAYVTNQLADTVTVIDVASLRSTTIDVGKKPNGLVFRRR